VSGFCGKVGRERERERIAGKMFQKLLLPYLRVRRGEDHAQCLLKQHRVLHSFFKKTMIETHLGNNLKKSYDSCPSL